MVVGRQPLELELLAPEANAVGHPLGRGPCLHQVVQRQFAEEAPLWGDALGLEHPDGQGVLHATALLLLIMVATGIEQQMLLHSAQGTQAGGAAASGAEEWKILSLNHELGGKLVVF